MEIRKYLPHKYALFDMDGTLFDTPKVYFQAHKQLASNLNGYKFSEGDQTRLMYQPRRTNQTSMDIFCEIIGYNLQEAQKEELTRDRRRLYEAALESEDIIKPGAEEILTFFEDLGITSLIVTASERKEVDRLFACQKAIERSRFSLIVSSDEISSYRSTRSKVDLIRNALARIQIQAKPMDCMMFEDSPAGVRDARLANIDLVVAIPERFTRDLANSSNFSFKNADIVVQDFHYLKMMWSNPLV